MKSILILFQSIFAYLSIISLILPVISITIAWKKRLMKDFDLNLFAISLLFGFVIQYSITVFAWYIYYSRETHELFWLVQKWGFNFHIFFQTTIIIFLFLKWANLKKHFPATIIVVYILLFAGYYFSDQHYPFLANWISNSIILFIAFYINYQIDNGNIKHLKNEHNYLIIGTYLNCMISVLGITPSMTEIINLGHVLKSIAIITSSYYYFLAYRNLFKKENLSIITNTQIIS